MKEKKQKMSKMGRLDAVNDVGIWFVRAGVIISIAATIVVAITSGLQDRELRKQRKVRLERIYGKDSKNN